MIFLDAEEPQLMRIGGIPPCDGWGSGLKS
jgi:hypothetical protein